MNLFYLGSIFVFKWNWDMLWSASCAGVGADRRAVIEETRRHRAHGDGVPRLMTRPWMPEIRSEPSGNGAALCATFYAANIEISR